MNSTVVNKFVAKTFRREIYRFSCLGQNAFKVNTDNNKEKKYKYTALPSTTKLLDQKSLCHVPFRIQKNCYRYMSNDGSTIAKSSEKLLTSLTPEISPAEEAAQIAKSGLSQYLIQVTDWKIVQIAQKSLLQIHEITGLPWWASIALTAFVARTTVTFPVSLYQVVFYKFNYFTVLRSSKIPVIVY